MSTVNDLRSRFDASPATREQYLQHAALRGATLAFNNPSRPEYPKPSNAGRREANTAANLARLSSRSTSPLPQHHTSNASYIAARSTFKTPDPLPSPSNTNESELPPWFRVGVRRGSSQSLQVPSFADERVKSPSSIAASLAAARHSPQRPEVSRVKSSQSLKQPRVVSETDPEPEDHLPAEGTVNDVRRWIQSIGDLELSPQRRRAYQPPIHPPSDLRVQKARPTSLVLPTRSETGSILGAQGSPPKILSPKPVRTRSSAAQSIEAASRAATRSQINTDSPSLSSGQFLDGTPARLLRNAATEAVSRKAPLTTGSSVGSLGPLDRPIPGVATAAAASASSNATASKPVQAAVRQEIRPALSQDFLSVFQPSAHSQALTSPVLHTPSERTSLDIPTRRFTPSLTGDSLASAIVGASLASSRVASPLKDARPPIVRRKTSPRYPFQHNKHVNSASRVGSPGKGFRYTMRMEELSSSEEERPFHKKSGHFGFRKHPNKHHEGDRRRWRDEITEKERKRYEGLWAANKGILISVAEHDINKDRTVLSESVSNVIVRDIWSRSRLPGHVLEEIWELVDRQHLGRLNREEFVVGLWLVDQRLKGRKVPAKIGASIWRSVVGIYGLKVPQLKDHH